MLFLTPQTISGQLKLLEETIGKSLFHRAGRRLDDWFEARNFRPTVIAEFDDSALLKAFGEAGLGLFPAPSAIADQVASMYASRRIGDVDGVHETYFAISPERKIKHSAVLMITESARARLFS